MCLIKFDKEKISQHNIDLISGYQYNFDIVTDEADGVRERTIEIYLNNIRLFAEWLQKNLEEATPEDINIYINTFNSRSTKNLKTTILKAFYEYLIGFYPKMSNPVRRKKQKSRRNGITRDKYLNKDQLKALFGEVKTEVKMYKKEGKMPYMYAAMKDYAVFQTLFRTGMRVSNVCGMKLSDIDWDRRIITIDRDDFKTDKNLKVSFGEDLIKILKDYLAIRDNLKPKSEHLFVSLRGNQLTSDAVYKALNKYADRTDCIDKISPHMMRHTCATILREQRYSLEEIGALLGHSSTQTTQIYAHTTEEMLRDVATGLDGVL